MTFCTIQAVYPGCPCGYSLLKSCKCYNGVTAKDPVCPSNYWFDEDKCECICNRHAECPTNYDWDVSECGCFCDSAASCPKHFEWDVSQCKCVCIRLCPQGKVLDKDSCTCVCESKCGECELRNPSNCACESYSTLLAAMVTSDPSEQQAYAYVNHGDHKYEYHPPQYSG